MDRSLSGSGPPVLIVEDEALTRLHAIHMVETAGFEAISAENADDAIGILEMRNDIRLVFTDIQMPGSMDGLGLARVVRERWPSIAVLVTSGRSGITPDELPGGLRFFPKPYTAAQIEAALRHFII